MFLYNQPIAHRFGKAFQQLIESGEWNSLDVAVAWVRRSGTRHVVPYLQDFLADGGTARFTVGVDIENTSQEGLEDLLSLAESGTSETFIYHNESAVTFHPKLYLFSNVQRARLIVGSNNLTEAGLFTNTEAGLQIDAGIDDEVIRDTRISLASWRDPSENLAKPLDQTLLNDLVSEGYVLPETKLQERRNSSKSTAQGGGSSGPPKRKLFGQKIYRAPPPPAPAVGAATPGDSVVPAVPAAPPGAAMVGRVLLMRVRRASETERRTQVQFPKRLVRTNFFAQVTEIQSAHDGRMHGLREAVARGIVNTIKVELPEIDPMTDPVVRLERTPTGIIYQAYDSTSVLGQPIMVALRRGLAQSPPSTELTVPANPDSSTWYRFI